MSEVYLGNSTILQHHFAFSEYYYVEIVIISILKMTKWSYQSLLFSQDHILINGGFRNQTEAV